MRIDMAAGRSWATDALRGLSAKRPQRLPIKFWIISLSSIFVVALLFMANSHLPPVPYLSHRPPHGHGHGPGPPPPPGPPPKEPEYYAGTTDPNSKYENGLKVWEPPFMDALVHGVRASEGVLRKPAYPLLPFPHSPMANPPPDNGTQRPWLGAVICSAFDVQRRMLIRATWMKLYKDVPMDQRFVISNPGPRWVEVIRQENRTYGDMIVLDHLQEDDFTANTVKTIEFYRWLVDKSPRKYEFVSKMDTDLFVNARGYWDLKLLPRLEMRDSRLRSTVNHTIIGQFFYDGYHRTSFPHGAIYTVTWDIVELLPRLQDEFHVIAGEDVTMAWLLMKGREKITLAVLNEAEKFEFDMKDRRPGEDTAWARSGTDITSHWHALYGNEALAIHQLKKDSQWLMVAECFDEQGIKEMPPYQETEQSYYNEKDPPGYPRPIFTQIPDDYWEVDHDGTFLCNGVWKLEPGVGRDMKRIED